MARHLRNPKIESRTARAKLKPSLKPTYFDLGGKLHLGYRRGKGAGAWVARRYIGSEQYATKTLAEADDLADANGTTVLNFAQAQDAARAWLAQQDKAASLAALGPTITVKAVIREYLEERTTFRDAIGKLRHLDPLAETPLAALTVADLRKWRAGLLDEKMTEAGARRVVNDVRACLNAAVRRHGDKLPPTLRDVIRDGLAVSRGVKIENEREKQILGEADIRRLIDAAMEVDDERGWGGDLYRMIVTLAATGARFDQVQRLRVADLQVEQRRIMVPTSRKGSGSKGSHVPVPLGDDVIDALKLATAGRKGTDPILLRPHWRPAPSPRARMEVYERSAWRGASTLTRSWKMIVKRSGLQDDLVPYCFRHTSIARGLSAGLPTQLVAQLHDTSVTMIERYYGRFVADALHKLARAAIVPLMPEPVEPLRVVRS
jgi:integrase